MRHMRDRRKTLIVKVFVAGRDLIAGRRQNAKLYATAVVAGVLWRLHASADNVV